MSIKNICPDCGGVTQECRSRNTHRVWRRIFDGCCNPNCQWRGSAITQEAYEVQQRHTITIIEQHCGQVVEHKLKLFEAKVRVKLIELGWTPPSEPNWRGICESLYHLAGGDNGCGDAEALGHTVDSLDQYFKADDEEENNCLICDGTGCRECAGH